MDKRFNLRMRKCLREDLNAQIGNWPNRYRSVCCFVRRD
jgi:hypothetical protein